MTIHRPVHTPWGSADCEKVYADGVIFYGTPSHGGFKLDPIRNARVHPALREPSAWYEEDAAWAKVAFAFPEIFTEEEREGAIRILKDYYPDGYETATGKVLAPGESHVKDQRQFQKDHAGDRIVIAVISSGRHPGMVECIATKGGARGQGGERRFLVPEHEYQQRNWRLGFVIDEARHAPYDGPSSFVTWKPVDRREGGS